MSHAMPSSDCHSSCHDHGMEEPSTADIHEPFGQTAGQLFTHGMCLCMLLSHATGKEAGSAGGSAAAGVDFFNTHDNMKLG